MNILQFDKKIKPLLAGYDLAYSSFCEGDFGDLERIEIEGFQMLASVELWSKGWVGIDVYNCALDEQVMNVLISPEEIKLLPQIFDELLQKLNVLV